MGQTEPFADDPGAAASEELPHLLRGGGASDVKIFWGALKEQIPDGAAHDVGFISGLL